MSLRLGSPLASEVMRRPPTRLPSGPPILRDTLREMARRRSPKRLYSVRHSPIHGRGVFALRRIPKDTRVIEYRGERISQEEADRRHEETNQGPFTLLFEVDDSTIIDAGVGGNSARYINHSCSPNCEAVNDAGRIFIEALRDTRPGEELTYDYLLETEEPMTPACRRYLAAIAELAAAGARCLMSVRSRMPATGLRLSTA